MCARGCWTLGIFAVANFTALSVAVVPIEQELGSTLNRVQWVLNGYPVVFGVLIVTGGRLADMFGRRKVFLIGAAVRRVLPARGVYLRVLVCVPQYPEKTLGWSPLEAGAGLLKMMLVVAAVPFAAGPPYHRVGGPVVIAAGAVCITVGALGRALSVDIGSVAIVPGLTICGAGVRAVLLRDHDAAITAHDTEDSSLAGGIVYMAQVGGASLGLGLNTAIVLSAAAFTDGIRNALVVDAALGLAFTLVAIALNRDRGQAVEAVS